MAEPRCIVTAPVAVARGLGFAELAMTVAADALVRRAWSLGRAAELVVPALVGDLAGQYAFDRELAREGHDRTSLQGDDLEARAASFAEDRRVNAAEVFARLSVTADLGLARTVTPVVALAARTAFVKLFEEGLVEEVDRVVATCPRCGTHVDGVDIEPGTIEGERLTLRLTTSRGDDIELVVLEPELLPGAVAVAMPDDDTSVGATMVIPLADRELPIVPGALHAAPGVVVPAHDADAHELAAVHGLLAVPVLDAEGAILAEGPLRGLGRYAARAAARQLLEAEGVVVRSEPAMEDVGRCGCCGTVLVPQLGRHWFLRTGDLEVAAADAVRHGLVAFSPADARDAFLASAGVRREWCLSTTVPTGVSVPAGLCLDCGKRTVDVEPHSSCGKCMGTLVAEPAHLDAHFLAAVWSLVLGGWPGSKSRPPHRIGEAASAGATNHYPPDEMMVVVSSADLVGWVLPALALGMRLAGAPPFAGVIVHPWPDVHAPDEGPFLDGDVDRRVLRLALVAGTDDLEPAIAAVRSLDCPFKGSDAGSDPVPTDVAEAAAAGVAALDDGLPAQAAGLLASALSAGVPAEAADRLRALAVPILGDG